MEMTAVKLWWALAGTLVVLELLTGTLYLLMFALGAVAAAVAAHLGATPALQVACAALLGGGATAVWRWRRAHHPRSLPAAENPDVNLDIGQHCQVEQWGPDRTARVSYRGSQWTAQLIDGAPAQPGLHQITAVDANRLWVQPAPMTH